MKYGFRNTATILSTICTCALAPPALAQFPPWVAVSDDLLADQRGGFVTPHGLQINFSLENVVLINGELRAHTILKLAGDASQTLAAAAAVTAVTAGATDTGASGSTGAGIAPISQVPTSHPITIVAATGLQTIIQNSLDQQNIQSLKILNLEIANTRALRSIGLDNRLQFGLIDGLR